MGGLTNGTLHRFQVRAVNDAGGGEPAETTATPAVPPVLAIADVQVAEGDGTAVLEVTLTPASVETVTVGYATADATATVGEDYTAKEGTLTFQAGETSGQISVRITDDTGDEDAETLTVALSDAVNAVIGDATGEVTIEDDDDAPGAPQDLSADPDDGRVALSWSAPSTSGSAAITVLSSPQGATISDGSGQVTILDNDGVGGTPSLAISNAGGSEGAGNLSVPVTLTNGGSGTVTVNWATENGTATAGQDYQTDNGTLTFGPGDAVKNITVSIIDDTNDENTESFTVRLSNAQGATIADSTGQITITDNDGGTTTVNPPSAPRSLGADPGDGQVRLFWTASATNGGASITRYEYRYAGGSDPFLATWTPVSGGSGATQVTVSPLTNGTNYRFQVRAVNSAGGGPEAATTATPVDATATPSLAVPDVTVGEGDGTAVVRVTLAPAASQTVTVAYATSNGSATAGEDYTAADGTLTFTTGTTAQEIRIAITDDTDGEGNETFTVTLSSAQGAEISRASGQVTIQDNDGTTTVVEAPDAPRALVAEEGDGEIELSWSPPASDGGAEIVRYEYRWAAGSDPLPEDWTVVSGGAEASRVKITGLENDVPHRFHVRAVNEAGGGDEAQEAATPQDAGGGEPPSLSIDDVSVGEGSGAAVLRVTMSEESDGAVTVRYETSDGSAIAGPDYTAGDGTLTLDAGTTAVEISISIRDDSEEEDNETFTVTLSSAQGADIEDGAGQVTILDNDGTATPEVPGAPRSLVADPRDGEVALSWAVPGSDGGSAVTRYEYRYATGSGSFPETWTVVSGGAGAREVTVGDLENGTRYRFQVRAVNGVGEGEPAEASATSRDPADAPGLTMDNPTVNEDDGVAVLMVRLSPASDQAVTVRYATVDGSATAGQDYTASSGALRFNAGETTQEIRVPIIDDDDEEGTESFRVRLSDPTNAVVVVGTGEVTIRDDEFGEGADPPGAPRDLVGVGEHRRVTLTWLEPESDGGAEITHYQYRFVEGSQRFPSVWTPIDGGRRVRRLRLGQLVNGITYRFQVRAVNPVGAGPPSLTDGTPAHPDSTPTFTITDADLGEGGGEATLTVTVSPPSSSALIVSYATADGTATAGEDYTETSGRLTFAARVTRQTITVPILDDEEEEGDETLTVNLSLGGSQDARIGQGEGVVTIRDDEGDRELTPPGPPRGLFGEGGDSLVTLTWRVPESDGGAPITHYEYRYAVVGRAFRTRWVGIVGQGRARELTVEGLENGTAYRLQVRAVNKVGAGDAAETTATPGEPGVRPSVSVIPHELEVEEGDSATYSIVLESEPHANVTVRMTTDLSDTDVTAEPSEMVFTPADWNEPREVLVRAAADEDVEDDLGILLTHEASGGGYTDVLVPTVTVDVREVPTVGAASARGTEGAMAELIFYVALNTRSDRVVSLKYETVDGTATAGEDYQERSGTLAFIPGTVVTGISVPLLNDQEQEDEESFRVELFDPVHATLEGGVERLVVTGTIVDDDETAKVSFGEANYEVNEGGTISVTVELSRDPGHEVQIPIEMALGEGVGSDDFSVAERVTFNRGQTSADIEFSATDDRLDEDDEVVVLTLGPTLPEGISAGDLPMTEITITDDDERGVKLSPEALELNEGDSATYTMELGSEPTSDVTVRMTADLSATDLAVDPVEAVFTPSDWNVPRTITVRSSVDVDHEDDLGIPVTHEASGGGYDGVLVPTLTVDVLDLRLPVIRGEDAVAEEGPGGAVDFIVRLSAASNMLGSVEYATVDGSAVAGQDYSERAGTLNLLPGLTEFVLSVPLLDDYTVEGPETFRVELFNPVNATLGDAGDRLVLAGTIEDNDELVVATFGAASYEVDEGGTLTVAVELSGDPGRAIQIPIVVTEGAGADRGDFSVARSVTFNRGERTVDLLFRSTGDEVDEDDELVTLELAPTLPEGVVAGDPVVTDVTIIDDDQRGVNVSVEGLEVEEGTSSTYTVQLTSQPTGTVRIAVDGNPAGSDLTVNPASLSFTPRNWRVQRTVTVTAAQDRDAIDEPVVTLNHQVTGADYAGVTASGVTVTILEDDTPVLSMADAQATEGDGEVVFEAVLDIQSSREIRVNYVSVAGTATEDVDYVRQAGTLVLAPLQTTARLVVPLIDDDVDEAAEHFTLEFSDFANAAPPGDFLSVTGTILDDDLPVLSINAVEQTVPEGTDARFRFVRAGDLTVTLSVPVTVRESGDFLAGAVPEAVDFAVGATEAILALPTEDDPLDERDGTVEATVAESDEYEISGSPTARLTVTDNDQTPAVIITGAQVAESAGEIALPVTLRGASAYQVSVDWMTADLTARAGEDYGAAVGRLTFAPGETTGEIRVTVVDDLLPEELETFSVNLSGSVNAVLEVGSATGTITDDDEVVTQAWLSRFGRTVASQVVEGITGRLVEGGGGRSVLNTAGARGALAGEGRKAGVGDLLDGSAFHFSQAAEGQAAAASGGVWTAWGRGMRASFEGAEAGLSVDGSVLTTLAGLDYERGPFLAGIAASHSLGDGTLTKAASVASRKRAEDVQSSLSSMYPYLRINFTDRVSVWGLGGYGRGNMSFSAARGAETGIGMTMGALGARAELLSPEGSGFNVALKSDAFLVRMSTDPGARTQSVDADASRIRFLLEAANRMRVGVSGVFAPMVEVGVRRDGGDAETGTGVEVGGGFRYANEAWGLSIEGSARMLVSHQDTAFSEWGAGGTLVFQPGGRERGLSVRMGTSWGAAVGGAEDLWSPYASGNIGARGRRGAGSGHGPGGRLTAQLHYAMSPFGEGLTMAPYTEIGLAGDGRGTSSRVGWRFDVMESLRLSLETNVAPAKSAEEGRGLVLRGRLLR